MQSTTAATPAALSADLLVATRVGDDPTPVCSELAALDEAALAPVRQDRRVGLAFWLNCYNAGTILLLERRPELYESRLRSLRFFRAPAVTIADHPLGLDDIEHGILRGSRSKFGLGYLPRLLPDSFELRHRMAEPDPRIHFALHCGAASCPAIRAYEPEAVDEQLDLATRAYLDATVRYDADEGTVRVPKVFRWFPGDFGGRTGAVEFLRRYDQLPSDATPTLRYLDWDWSRTEPTFVD